MNIDEIIKENLIKIRKSKKLTQEDLSRFLGINRAVISYYENGERTVPVKDLEKYARFFGVDMDDLLEENKESFNYNLAFAYRASTLAESDILKIEGFKLIFEDYCRLNHLSKKHEKQTFRAC
ncbi:DNA-binding XRE family transcriptional regulator [Dyadobacter jejuensis]|uniref:DNA-binding XRE family transcriptional regulator n=1 Tax=Dyadobacter jejuensis TaxID=1082580 RepID=A0A316A404_9BACT|nr:helix-turn-helix transcriptional regulator [Dyadobacter jejuensis]PWJ52621.1 DNA-binding XRE family transcriptional regulator [Dyadobacter jejuensis]